MKKTRTVTAQDKGRSVRRRLEFNAVSDATEQGLVKWVEVLPPEMWALLPEQSSVQRLDFEWINRFARLSRRNYEYSKNESVWRYLYEALLVAPAAKPSSNPIESLVNIATPSYAGLRDECDVHFDVMLPYVFHYGQKTDLEENAIYASPADLPRWKVWKRMVEIHRRRRTMIMDLQTSASLHDVSTLAFYNDFGDYGYDSAREAEIQYDADVLRQAPRKRPVSAMNTEINFSSVYLEPEEISQPNVHKDSYTASDYAVLPACPWPAIVTSESFALRLPNNETVGCKLQNPCIYTAPVSSCCTALVQQRGGIVNIIGTSTRPNEPEDIVIAMQSVNLRALIERALQRIQEIKVSYTASQKMTLVPEAHLNDYRVLFSTKTRGTVHRRFPMADRFESDYVMPVSISASRDMMVLGFHHGLLPIAWNYAKAEFNIHEFYYWTHMTDRNPAPSSVPPPASANDELLPRYRLGPSMVQYLPILLHSAQAGIVPPGVAQVANEAELIYPPKGVSAQYKSADYVEVACDPLGTGRAVVVLGVYLDTRCETLQNFIGAANAAAWPIGFVGQPLANVRMQYLVFALTLRPTVRETRAHLVAWSDSSENPVHYPIYNAHLRPSLDGVAILLPNFRPIGGGDTIAGINYFARFMVVAWLDVQHERRTALPMCDYRLRLNSETASTFSGWTYQPGGIMALAQAQLVAPEPEAEDPDLLVMITFFMPLRGGWRQKINGKDSAFVIRFIRQRVALPEGATTVQLPGYNLHMNNNLLFVTAPVFINHEGGDLASYYLEFEVNLSFYELGPQLGDSHFNLVVEGASDTETDGEFEQVIPIHFLSSHPLLQTLQSTWRRKH